MDRVQKFVIYRVGIPIASMIIQQKKYGQTKKAMIS